MAEALFTINLLSIELWINGALAIVAVAGFITSLIFSIIANKNLNYQIRLQSRPILKLSEVEDMKPKRILEVKNIGTGPAFNMKYVAGLIDEQKDFRSIKPIDPISFNSLGVHETHRIEFETENNFQAVLLQLITEVREQTYMLYTLIYYEDIFGDCYTSEAYVTLKQDNVLVLDTNQPKKLTKKQIKMLIREMSAETKKQTYRP